MNKLLGMGLCVGLMIFMGGLSEPTLAGELDDGISTYRDDPIKNDDQALKPDTNLNFIIQDAIAASKSGRNDKDSKNFNDGSGENNQNSIIVGPGTQTGDVINVIIEK